MKHSRLIKVNGDLYITLRRPVEFIIEDTDGEYNPESEFADSDGWVSDPEPYGVDDILEQGQNKQYKTDIELMKRLGWNIEEILCEHNSQKYI